MMWTDIASEAESADQKYGPFRSTHEGLGVLMEEVHELIEAIRLNSPDHVRNEAIQVSAVAYRIAQSLDHEETRARSGMTQAMLPFSG